VFIPSLTTTLATKYTLLQLYAGINDDFNNSTATCFVSASGMIAKVAIILVQIILCEAVRYKSTISTNNGIVGGGCLLVISN
jgi:hypothetical protein